jgi:hypothetical protein
MLSLSKHDLHYQSPFDRLRVTNCGSGIEIQNNFSPFSSNSGHPNFDTPRIRQEGYGIRSDIR